MTPSRKCVNVNDYRSGQGVSGMTMVLISQEEWQALYDKLEHLAEMIENRNATDRNAEWLESEAARKLLGVSPKTWQNYRDQRVIPFSQIGRKIYVNRADLDAYLSRHRIGKVKSLNFEGQDI